MTDTPLFPDCVPAEVRAAGERFAQLARAHGYRLATLTLHGGDPVAFGEQRTFKNGDTYRVVTGGDFLGGAEGRLFAPDAAPPAVCSACGVKS